MSLFRETYNLAEALLEVAGETLAFDAVLSDLKLVLSRQIVARLVNISGNDQQKWARLIADLREIPSGLTGLIEVLEIHLDHKENWTPCVLKLQDYQRRWPPQADLSAVDTPNPSFSSLIASERRRAFDHSLARLHSLAITHQSITPDLLARCLNAAIHACHPRLPPAQAYYPVFAEGPVQSWDELLDRLSSSNQYFDEKFLDVLDKNLSGLEDQPPVDDLIGSLVLMLLTPRNRSTSNTYSFRAYYCGHQSKSPEDWVKLFEPSADVQIRCGAWRHDLEGELPKLLRKVLAMRQSVHEKLLIEIFLPTDLIDANIRTLKLPLASDCDPEDLGATYRVVARSAWRYQYFVERKNDVTRESPLIDRWQCLSNLNARPRASCYWWHDTIKESAGDKDLASREATKYFTDLRAMSEYFGMKRLSDIPPGVCYETWKNKLMDASPAIALWWPPASTSQLEHRQMMFHSPQVDRGDSLFGACQCDEQNPESDPFHPPGSTDPLKLFFSLSNSVFRGQFKKDHSGQAFREMVLLVDSPDRWPLPLDYSPVSQSPPSQPGQPGQATIDRDDMLMFG